GRSRRSVRVRARPAGAAAHRAADARRPRGGASAVSGHLDRIHSAYSGMVWPAVPAGGGALALALQLQLERSQWQAPETLRGAQFYQLGAVLKHGYATIPFYRERFDA